MSSITLLRRGGDGLRFRRMIRCDRRGSDALRICTGFAVFIRSRNSLGSTGWAEYRGVALMEHSLLLSRGRRLQQLGEIGIAKPAWFRDSDRSEEHTSELQSHL